MPLLGKAAVAMWWNIRAEQRSEFGDWHSHEHFPERMGIPGFRRGSRWASLTDREGFFVLYELERYETLASEGYLARLNAPTSWSRKMMPHHLDMVRSQCRIEASFGGGVAATVATIRVSPRYGQRTRFKTALIEKLRELPSCPGLTGAHLLVTDAPKAGAPTTEQRIRGGDGAADWIVLLSGYDPDVVQETAAEHLSSATLGVSGAEDKVVTGHYRLAYAATPEDFDSRPHTG